MKKLDVKLNMSMTFHPQTDDQSEILNQILEQYLRTFCNYYQDDWLELLLFTEFSYNNLTNVSMKMTSFYISYEQHPHSVWPSDTQEKYVTGNKYMNHFEEIREKLQMTLLDAQEYMQRYYDEKREPQPNFQVRDKVILNVKNIQTLWPSKKLNHQMHEP